MNQADSEFGRIWQRICTSRLPDARAQRPGTECPLSQRFTSSAVVVIGALSRSVNSASWESQDLFRFCLLPGAGDLGFAAESGAARRSRGALSVLFIFILFGIVELSLPEALLHRMRGHSDAVFWNYRATAQAASGAVQPGKHGDHDRRHQHGLPFQPAASKGTSKRRSRLVVTATVFFVMNTFPVAAAIALTEDEIAAAASGANAISGRSRITCWAR